MDLRLGHAGIPRLLADLRGKVDLIRGRADAGAELDDDILRTRAVVLLHLFNGLRGDAHFRALFPGMHHAKGTRARIGQIHRAAVCHVDADDQPRGIGNDAVRACDGAAWGLGDHRHLPAMHLLGDAQRRAGKAQLRSLRTVPVPQPRHHHGALVIHVDLRVSQGEAVREAGQAFERGESHPKLIVTHSGNCSATENKKAHGKPCALMQKREAEAAYRAAAVSSAR